MRYRVTEVAGGSYEVSIHPPLPGCEALPMRLERLPERLRQGSWLVLCFAVWSETDHESVEMALERAERAGPVRLALYPFERHEEIAAAFPGTCERSRSPVWLLLLDGRLVREASGPLAACDLAELERSSG